MTLERFASDLEALEHVISTAIVTDEDGTEFAQIAWDHNPANSAVEIHNIYNGYDSVVQVSPSEYLRDQNPDDAEFTQYYKTR